MQSQKTYQEHRLESLNILSNANSAPITCFESVLENAITDADFHFPVIQCHVPFIDHTIRHFASFSKMDKYISIIEDSADSVYGSDFFSRSTDDEVISDLSHIPVSTLFGILLNSRLADVISRQVTYDLTLPSSSPYRISYMGKEILQSLHKGYNRKSLSIKTIRTCVYLMLNDALEYLSDKKISSVMLIKLVNDAFDFFPKITTSWVIDSLAKLAIHHFACKEIVNIIFTSFKTPKNSIHQAIKAIFTNLSAHDFLRILCGESHSHFEYLNDQKTQHINTQRGIRIKLVIEKILQDAGSHKKSILKTISLLKTKYDERFPLTPELITSSFFHVTVHQNDCLSNMDNLSEIEPDTKKWLIKQAKISTNFDLDLSLASVLLRMTDSKIALEKIAFLLDSFDKEDSYVPSPRTVSIAIAQGDIEVIKMVVSLRVRTENTVSDYDAMASGISKQSSTETLEWLFEFFEPYFDSMVSSDEPFEALKKLQKVKESQQILAKMYASKHVDDTKALEKIKGKKQLQFYLETFNYTPYDILSKNINSNINNLCIGLMGE